jgi:hypothetical protein
MKLPRYRISSAWSSSIPIGWRAGHTYGSSRPFVAAVLCTQNIVLEVGPEHDVVERRWTVARTSYTKLAAQLYCDQLRGRGYSAIVVDMEPAS